MRRSAIPYGYTLTIWTSGAAIEHSHGTPTVSDTFLFLIRAVGGFALLGSLSQINGETPLNPKPGDLIRTGLIQILAVGLALGAAALVACDLIICSPSDHPAHRLRVKIGRDTLGAVIATRTSCSTTNAHRGDDLPCGVRSLTGTIQRAW